MIRKTPAKKKKERASRSAGAAAKFDVDDPTLSEGFDEHALRSGGYPYDTLLKRKAYDSELEALQYELVKLQAYVRKAGLRLVVVFEGRDAAGKGSCIRNFTR